MQRFVAASRFSEALGVILRTVLASLATGDSLEDILADFPALKPEDVQAAIAFAALRGRRPACPSYSAHPMKIKLDENLSCASGHNPY